eukprot:Gb_35055 [translate_table: standard]
MALGRRMMRYLSNTNILDDAFNDADVSPGLDGFLSLWFASQGSIEPLDNDISYHSLGFFLRVNSMSLQGQPCDLNDQWCIHGNDLINELESPIFVSAKHFNDDGIWEGFLSESRRRYLPGDCDSPTPSPLYKSRCAMRPKKAECASFENSFWHPDMILYNLSKNHVLIQPFESSKGQRILQQFGSGIPRDSEEKGRTEDRTGRRKEGEGTGQYREHVRTENRLCKSLLNAKSKRETEDRVQHEEDKAIRRRVGQSRSVKNRTEP